MADRHKGGREGGKRRAHDAKQHNKRHNGGDAGAEGAQGLDAWSKDSLADFAADQALLQQKQELEAQHKAQAAAAAAAGGASSTAAESSAPSAAVAAAAASAAAPAAAFASSVSSLPSSLSFREVDGSLLEGGGQVLRNAMAYSALLAQPLRIFNIRAGRPSGGGLKAQHLKGLHLVEEMSAGKLRDAHIGSRNVEFEAGKGDLSQLQNPRAAPDAQGRTVLCFEADTQTAGATGLLLQVGLPVAFFLPNPVCLTLKGGTNATMAPLIDFTTDVFAPLLERAFGLKMNIDLVTRGFFPKGGGVLHVTTEPVASLPAINLTHRGHVVKFSGTALVTHRLPVHIAQRMVDVATRVLRRDAGYRSAEVDIRCVVCDEAQAPLGDGVSLLLTAHTSTGAVLAASNIGARGLPAETLANSTAEQLLANLDAGGVVDEHTQDQLIIFMALAKGTSTIKTGPLTLHTRTALFWASFFTGAKVQVQLARDAKYSSWHTPEPSDTRDTVLVRIEGMGYESRFKKK